MIGFLNFEVAAGGKIVLRKDVMEMKWSEWLPFGEVELGGLPEKEGIYQFRCVDEKGTPIMISRLKGEDSNGIIYTGSSENLKNRIKGFWKTIENWDRSRHAAAWTYCTFKYDSLFPTHNLQFRYIATESTTRYEFDLLLGYRKKFMDLLPLNSNRPPYPCFRRYPEFVPCMPPSLPNRSSCKHPHYFSVELQRLSKRSLQKILYKEKFI